MTCANESNDTLLHDETTPKVPGIVGHLLHVPLSPEPDQDVVGVVPP